VLLVHGYCHPAFGIRARVRDAECTDFAATAEIVLRDDGGDGDGDGGSPWATLVSDARALASVTSTSRTARGTSRGRC
jgi:hypothetical protein